MDKLARHDEASRLVANLHHHASVALAWKNINIQCMSYIDTYNYPSKIKLTGGIFFHRDLDLKLLSEPAIYINILNREEVSISGLG